MATVKVKTAFVCVMPINTHDSFAPNDIRVGEDWRGDERKCFCWPAFSRNQNAAGERTDFLKTPQHILKWKIAQMASQESIRDVFTGAAKQIEPDLTKTAMVVLDRIFSRRNIRH